MSIACESDGRRCPCRLSGLVRQRRHHQKNRQTIGTGCHQAATQKADSVASAILPTPTLGTNGSTRSIGNSEASSTLHDPPCPLSPTNEYSFQDRLLRFSRDSRTNTQQASSLHILLDDALTSLYGRRSTPQKRSLREAKMENHLVKRLPAKSARGFACLY